MRNLSKKTILSRENAEYLLGKGLSSSKSKYVGKVIALMECGVRLDTGAYILYKCCLNNYKIVKPKDE